MCKCSNCPGNDTYNIQDHDCECRRHRKKDATLCSWSSKVVEVK